MSGERRPRNRPRSRRGVPTTIRATRWLVTAVLVSLGVAASPTPAAAQSDEAVERELAERFAPVIEVKRQDGECDSEGEPFAPMPVDVVLDNPQIALRQVGRSDPVVMRAPGASDLFGLGEGFYLDFPGDSLSPGCIYEKDFDRYTEGVTPAVYARVSIEPHEPDGDAGDPGGSGVDDADVYVQYWFWWYYNDWNNTHESDWEGIVLRFDAPTPEAALADGPAEVGYAQHEGGERATWGDDGLDLDGERPVVHSSRGSHASYFGSALYLGRSASEGFGCDETSDPSDRLRPDVIVLPETVESADDPFAWIAYEGRWGERQSGPFNGPTGPNAKERWDDPAAWFDELREASVVVPAGDSQARFVVDVFCGLVEGGSSLLIVASTSPAVLAAAAVLIFLGLRTLARRTSWTPVPTRPLRRDRRTGQAFRGAFDEYRRSPLGFALLAVVYVPTSIVVGLIALAVQQVPFVDALFGVSGDDGGTNLFFALLIGSAAGSAALFAVNAVVALVLDSPDRGVAVSVDAIRAAWGDHRTALVGGFVRSFAIVAILIVTIVGTPWAIRQAVRYQFVAHVTVLEGRSGDDALRRSSELVRGRWWRTAATVVVLNGALLVVSVAVAVVALALSGGLPLWVFSGLLSLSVAVLAPFVAIVMTLLYGAASVRGDAGPDDDGGGESPVPAEPAITTSR